MDIHVENLEHVYNKGTPLEIMALRQVSFQVKHETCLAVTGGVGSGKTTLVKHLNGLLYPTKGRVLVGGRDTRDWGSSLRRKVGLVFQSPERQLFEETATGDISFALRRSGWASPEEIEEKVAEVCDLLGLNAQEMEHRSPLTFSQGIRRKIAIAGVMVNDPEVLILDEPGAGLDPPSTAELKDLLGRLKNEADTTVVIVSHDVESFLPIVDNILVLAGGVAQSMGSPARVCEELGEDPRVRHVLPGIALLARDLQKAGFPIETGEYNPSHLADRIARAAGGVV